MTLVARPIPPTPPQSTDGHPLPEEPFGGNGVYRRAYNDMSMSDEEIINRKQEMVSLLSSGCCLITTLTILALRFSSIL